MGTQGIDNNHCIKITTLYNLGVYQSQGVFNDASTDASEFSKFRNGDCLMKNCLLRYMPDYFKLGILSDFDRIQVTTSLGQFAMYTGSKITDLMFSIRYIQGVDNAVITSRNQYSQSQESVAMATLIQHLYTLALPQVATFQNGLPPPKSVLTIGSIFQSVGVFSEVNVEYRGPYDKMGNALEAEITFNFIPTQFYDPVRSPNKVGVNLETQVSQNDIEALAAGSNKLDKLLEYSPAGNNIIDNQFILYLGPR